MKGLELNISTLLAQHVHHELEIVRIANVSGHYGEVVAVEEQLAEQFERLTPRDVVVRVEEFLVVFEEDVVVLFEKAGTQRLVFGQEVAEREERVRGDVERGQLDVVEELVEVRRVEYELGQLFVAAAFAQHHATIQRDFLHFIAVDESIEYVGFGSDVIDRGRSVADLTSQQVVEYRRDVFLAFEVNSMYVLDHDAYEIGVVDLLGELGDHLGLRIVFVRPIQNRLDAADAFR